VRKTIIQSFPLLDWLLCQEPGTETFLWVTHCLNEFLINSKEHETQQSNGSTEIRPQAEVAFFGKGVLHALVKFVLALLDFSGSAVYVHCILPSTGASSP
jgi:hypothetical protein